MKEKCLKLLKAAKENIILTICVIVIFIIIALIIVAFAYIIGNENNAISEGTIVDKHYTAAHSYTSYNYYNGKSFPQQKYDPERYSFTIRGENNGKTVDYVFNVPESEYSKYDIGDYYRR